LAGTNKEVFGVSSGFLAGDRVLLYKQLSEEFIRIEFMHLPFKLFIFCVFGFMCCVSAQSNLPPFKIATELQTILDDGIAHTGTVGAVLLVQTPSFTWLGSSGFTNLETSRLMQTTDTLRIASMTKTFVSAIILLLSEENKLDLDDLVSQYLPNSIMDNIPFGNEITIRQLLNMTSGVYDYTESDAFADAIEANPLRSPWKALEVLEYVYSEEAVFKPGQGWAYSNSNYVLLDILIQAVTSKSLEAEFERLIVEPLNLNQTYMESPTNISLLNVRGYEDDWQDITSVQDGLGLGDGGAVSDALGISSFLNALLLDKTLINTSSLNTMLDFQTREDYGLGLVRRLTDFGEAWGHSGASFGFEGDMLVYPEHEVIVVVLSNTMDADLSDFISAEIMEIILN